MELVDTHCHIQSAGRLTGGEKVTRQLWSKQPELSGEQIIKDASAVGVKRLICVGCDPADSQLAHDFALKYPETWSSVGIHPHEAKHFPTKVLDKLNLKELAKCVKVVAIGECGLDYFYTHSDPTEQARLLCYQLELAAECNLPLIFHVREAFSDFWTILNNYPKVKGVLHSFTDNPQNLERALARGLYLGVNGIATFTKNPDQRAMYKSIPLTNLLLETDAPFLTPTPYRGKINQSKYVRDVASFLAEIRDVSVEELAKVTTENALQLFWPNER